MATQAEKNAKDANARFRACMDREMTHLRLTSGLDVQLLGTPAALHGTQCTCCPRRGRSAS